MTADILQSIQFAVSNEDKIKGSRFISMAAPVRSKEEAEQVIAQQRQHYHDATHHCYAYRIGIGEEEYFRYSDAGEPSGTAGKPIYMAILGRQLTNIVLVVTRYFGGTKLGTGGLARAYAQSAVSVLERAKVKSEYLTETYLLRFSYDLLHSVLNAVARSESSIIASRYEDSVVLKVAVRLGRVSAFKEQLVEQTAGKIEMELVEDPKRGAGKKLI